MPSTLWGIDTIYLMAGAAVVLLILAIIASSGSKRKEANKESAATPIEPIAFIPEPEPELDFPQIPDFAPQPEIGLSAKTVAAIMAAVSAASGTPVSQLHFTAIRRTSGMQGSWANSGTADIINARQTYL